MVVLFHLCRKGFKMLGKTDYDSYEEDSWEKIRNKNGKYQRNRNKFNLADKILEEEDEEDSND
jgi:hypothetical protein